MKKITDVPIMWENSIKNFDTLDIKNFYSNVENFAEQFNEEFPLRNVEVHISQTSKEEGFDSKNFMIVFHLHFKNGKIFISKAENPNVNSALSEVIRELRSQTELSDHQKHFIAVS